MTDVLELLLREAEEDESERESEWSVAGVPGIAGAYAAQTESFLREEQQQRTRNAELPEERKLSTQIGADSLHRLNTAQTLREAVWSISDRMTRLRQAAQRQERRNAQPGGLAVSPSGHEAHLLRGASEHKRYTADYAAQVDAAFARDARRYDGPLRLL